MVRASGHLSVGAEVGLSDHAAWAYKNDQERAEAAVSWLAGGLRAGQRALYVAEGSPDELVAELTALPDAAAAIESGALVVVPSTALYDLSQPIDAAAQLALYAGAVDESLAAGYRGLRVAADITPLVFDPARRDTHVQWEQFADRYIADHPLAPLCMYDTRRIDSLDAIVCVHPLQGPGKPLFALYGVGSTQAVLEGEVDACVADVFAEVLRTMPATDETLDIRGLSFIDGRSAWTLYDEVTRRRAAGHPITVSGASSIFRRVWQVCGFDPSVLAAA
jgi:anti-anti-sigma regulatory factor